MKKLVFTFLIVLIAFPSFAAVPKAKQREDNKKEIVALAEEYQTVAGFMPMEIGNFLMGIATSAMRLEAKTPEEKMAVKVMKKVDSMLVVAIDSTASTKDRDAFNERLLGILSNDDMIAKDTTSGKDIYTYIHTLKKGDEVEAVTEFVMYSPDAGFLSCMWGKFTMDELEILAVEAGKDEE